MEGSAWVQLARVGYSGVRFRLGFHLGFSSRVREFGVSVRVSSRITEFGVSVRVQVPLGFLFWVVCSFFDRVSFSLSW